MSDEQIRKNFTKLSQIKSYDEIESIEVGDVYEDDHCLCVDTLINGITLEFLWYDFDAINMVVNHSIHKEGFFELFKERVEMELDMLKN